MSVVQPAVQSSIFTSEDWDKISDLNKLVQKARFVDTPEFGRVPERMVDKLSEIEFVGTEYTHDIQWAFKEAATRSADKFMGLGMVGLLDQNIRSVLDSLRENYAEIGAVKKNNGSHSLLLVGLNYQNKQAKIIRGFHEDPRVNYPFLLQENKTLFETEENIGSRRYIKLEETSLAHIFTTEEINPYRKSLLKLFTSLAAGSGLSVRNMKETECCVSMGDDRKRLIKILDPDDVKVIDEKQLNDAKDLIAGRAQLWGLPESFQY